MLNSPYMHEDSPNNIGIVVTLKDPPPSFRSNVQRSKRGKTFNNPKYTAFRRLLQFATTERIIQKFGSSFEPWTGPVGLAIDFNYPLTKDTPRSVREKLGSAGAIRKTTTPDVDNIGKGVLDALQGVLYEKDSQVTDLVYNKRYTDTHCPHVGILAWRCEELETYDEDDDEYDEE